MKEHSASICGSLEIFLREDNLKPEWGAASGIAGRGHYLDGSPVPILYPYSPHVLPVPEDFPPHVHVTGYWFLDRSHNWKPELELVQFLEAGTPPVYIGFGSMGGQGGHRRAEVVFDALKKSGQRGVIARGWGGSRSGNHWVDIQTLSPCLTFPISIRPTKNSSSYPEKSNINVFSGSLGVRIQCAAYKNARIRRMAYA